MQLIVSPHGSIMSLRHPFVARGHDVLATNLCDQGCLYDLLFYFCICIFIRSISTNKSSLCTVRLNFSHIYDRVYNGFQWASCCSICGFLCSVLQIVVCPIVLFLLAIVLSVFQFADSPNPFGIFKLVFFLMYFH